MKRKVRILVQQRYREIIAKTLHDKGDCGFDYGAWYQMVKSGAECGCYEKSDWIVGALVDTVPAIRAEVQSLPSFGVLSLRPFDYMISRNQVLAILDKYAEKSRANRG